MRVVKNGALQVSATEYQAVIQAFAPDAAHLRGFLALRWSARERSLPVERGLARLERSLHHRACPLARASTMAHLSINTSNDSFSSSSMPSASILA